MKKLILYVVIISLFSCGENPENSLNIGLNNNINDSEVNKKGKLLIKMKLEKTDITKVNVFLKKEDFELSKDLTILNTLASGSFSDLLPGLYFIEINAYRNETVIAIGTGEAEVKINETVSTDITLTLLTGDLEVDVKLPEIIPEEIFEEPTYDLKIKGIVNQTESLDDVKFLGEVINYGNNIASFVKIEFLMFNSGGDLIDKEHCYINGNLYFSTNLNISIDTGLGNNEFGSFKCYTDVPEKSLYSYETNVTYSTFSVKQPKTTLIVHSNITESINFIGFREFSGIIKNTNGSTVSFIRINFTLKDSENLVIDTAFSYLDGQSCNVLTDNTNTCLAVNDTGSFKVSSLVESYDSYYYRIYHSEYNMTKPKVKPLFTDSGKTLSPKEKQRIRTKKIDSLLKIL